MTDSVGFLSIAFSSEVYRRSLRVALLVGTLLVLINYGDRLMAGGAVVLTAPDLVKIVLTYLVPYGVSTWSTVRAIQDRQSQD
ncbi:MAG: nitrate/nitrite transporter NrtS [Pseudomonadota bacterium]